LADIGEFAFDVQSAGPVEIVPLGKIVAHFVEYLHTVIFSISDINLSVPIRADAMNQVELSAICAILAPREKMLPISGVFVYFSISITIGYV
jgi:hypothetical protein